MAVVQISRIQARRGLQQDLPTLASAELGWSVDTRKLYIGNGTLGEGAPTEGVTEILTQYTDFAAVLKNYTFKGNAGGYTAQTTTSPLSPIVRTIQDKLDDFVNVKDFGAVGDGVANDTAAINRAITQIYLTTRLANYPQVRRTIFFPAGTYNVTGATILIPPYARFVGDGIESTIIKQTDNTQAALIQFTDSMYQTGAMLGQNSATLPGYITMEHMTLATTSDNDIALIDSAEHVTFNGVEFLGSLSSPTTNGSKAGAKVNSFARTTQNVNFWSCKFKNTRHAVLSDDASTDVKLNGCLFVGLYKGLRLGQNSASVPTTPSNYKVLNSVFVSVANAAIDCYANVTGILSSGNHFIDVGNNFAGAGSPVASVISYIANGNYSVSDTFDRNSVDNLVVPRLSYANAKNVSLDANVGLTVGTYTVGTGGYAVLPDNVPTLFTSNVTLINGCSLSYSITRGPSKRSGVLVFTNDGSTGANFSDNYVVTGTSIGVILAVSNANVLLYSTTSTGTDAILKYNINYFG